MRMMDREVQVTGALRGFLGAQREATDGSLSIRGSDRGTWDQLGLGFVLGFLGRALLLGWSHRLRSSCSSSLAQVEADALEGHAADAATETDLALFGAGCLPCSELLLDAPWSLFLRGKQFVQVVQSESVSQVGRCLWGGAGCGVEGRGLGVQEVRSAPRNSPKEPWKWPRLNAGSLMASPGGAKTWEQARPPLPLQIMRADEAPRKNCCSDASRLPLVAGSSDGLETPMAGVTGNGHARPDSQEPRESVHDFACEGRDCEMTCVQSQGICWSAG